MPWKNWLMDKIYNNFKIFKILNLLKVLFAVKIRLRLIDLNWIMR
jgi:hypothetical protein